MNTQLQELINRLETMKARAAQLCGRAADGGPLSAAVTSYLDTLIKDTTDPDKQKARLEFLKDAPTNKAKQDQLCGLRVEQFQNYVLADNNIMSLFFEIINLGESDRPAYQNNTKQEIRIGSLSQDGSPTRAKIIKSQEEGLIDLGVVTTPEVHYKVMDLYNGRIADTALANIQLAYDMSNELDKRCWNLLTASVVNGGAFGAFTFTNPNKASWIYVPNSRIVTANLPDTNDITVVADQFDYEVLDAICFYARRWGKAFLEGPIIPTGRILINPRDAATIGDEIKPTGDTSNSIAERMMLQGYTNLGLYKGVNWTLVEDNTLDTGFCIAEFNRKPGQVFFKPALDKEDVNDSYELRKVNEQARYMQKVFGATIPSHRRVNVARFTWNAGS